MADDKSDSNDGDETTDPGVVTLGPCHYNLDEEAVAVAVEKGGGGWIPVCEEHKKEAEKDGYEIRPDVKTPDDFEAKHETLSEEEKDPNTAGKGATASADGDGDDDASDDDDKADDDEADDDEADDDESADEDAKSDDDSDDESTKKKD